MVRSSTSVLTGERTSDPFGAGTADVAGTGTAGARCSDPVADGAGDAHEGKESIRPAAEIALGPDEEGEAWTCDAGGGGGVVIAGGVG